MGKTSQRSSRLSVSTLTYGALFAALLVVLAQIYIPIPMSPVSVTLQTLGLMLSALFLRPVNALMSTLVYVLLGAAGVPVFSGFGGGMGRIMGPAGGFILAFPLIAFLLSLCLRKAAMAGRKSKVTLWVWRVVGLLLFHGILYAAACLWYSWQGGVTWAQAAASLVVPFLPGDVIKSVLFIALIPLLAKRLPHTDWQGNGV